MFWKFTSFFIKVSLQKKQKAVVISNFFFRNIPSRASSQQRCLIPSPSVCRLSTQPNRLPNGYEQEALPVLLRIRSVRLRLLRRSGQLRLHCLVSHDLERRIEYFNVYLCQCWCNDKRAKSLYFINAISIAVMTFQKLVELASCTFYL